MSVSKPSRGVLQDLNPNSCSWSQAPLSDIVAKVTYARTANIIGADQAPQHGESTETHKIIAERDKLQDEVRRLTKELAQIQEAGNTSAWQKITSSAREIKRLETELQSANSYSDQLTEKIAVLSQNNARLSEEKSQQVIFIQEVEAELKTSKKIIQSLTASLDQSKISESILSQQIQLLSNDHMEAMRKKESDLMTLENECKALNEKLLTAVTMQESNCLISFNDQQTIPVEMSSSVFELQQKLLQSEKIRKKLLNKIHELQGNIRVFVRCRPFLRGDEEYCQRSEKMFVHCSKDTNIISMSSSTKVCNTVDLNPPTHTFAYDQVFDQDSSQSEVFNAVSDLIQSALDGYRVCVFAYGQTGAGIYF